MPQSPQTALAPDDTVDPVASVLNQSPPLADYNLFLTDRALAEAVRREGAAPARTALVEAGETFGRADVLALGDAANRYKPELRTHDAQGRRIDRVDFHPAWHDLLELSLSRGIVALAWEQGEGAMQVARAGLHYLYSQVESGTQCPIAMTYAAIPVLRRHTDTLPALAETWLPGLMSREYDPRLVHASEKRGLLMGMGLTERQGGSDVRRNITVASPVSGSGAGKAYRITGHKWFFSAPMCDAFLVLAQAPGGLGCFFMPRVLDDGSLNAIRIQRLKDKLGNHSNASSEVEFHGANAWLLGEEGRGVATIIEMATYTRLDCVLATAGMQRRLLAIAINHAMHREAFGKRLADQPLMQNVLADLALESEAATALGMRLAKTFDETASEGERLLGRVLTPAAKYHVCKRGPYFAAEAMESIGGNGYVEESPVPRFYRELPLVSIWEGSGNVMCLDVQRALAREPAVADALRDELAAAAGEHPDYDRFLEALRGRLTGRELEQAEARRLAHDIVLGVQASVLLRHAPGFVAETFCRSRLGEGRWGEAFGTLGRDAPCEAIVERAAP